MRIVNNMAVYFLNYLKVVFPFFKQNTFTVFPYNLAGGIFTKKIDFFSQKNNMDSTVVLFMKGVLELQKEGHLIGEFEKYKIEFGLRTKFMFFAKV